VFVKIILLGCEIDKLDENGKTWLYIACLEGNVDNVKKLVATDEMKIKAKNKFGQVPLHLVADSGHLSVVEILLKHDGGIEAIDARKRTPIMSAASQGHLSVVKLLVENGANVIAKMKNMKKSVGLPKHAFHFRSAHFFLSFFHCLDNQKDIETSPVHYTWPLKMVTLKLWSSWLRMALK
jgi:hypothetical protein